jgi:hypothetical protein
MIFCVVVHSPATHVSYQCQILASFPSLPESFFSLCVWQVETDEGVANPNDSGNAWLSSLIFVIMVVLKTQEPSSQFIIEKENFVYLAFVHYKLVGTIF